MSTTRMTTQIVVAYVDANQLPAADLPSLIRNVDAALRTSDVTLPSEPAETAKTRAQITRSISHEGLRSFLDGKIYKSLKRHVSTHGLTPAEYRERFALPGNYPMVSAAYSAARSALAKSIGLGKRGRAAKAKSRP